MSTITLPDEPRSSNPFEAARLLLIKQLLALKAPRPISPFPLVSDFLSIRDHLVDVVKIMDEWMETVGFQVGENTTCSEFDIRSFNGVFSGAVDGNATFVLEECAEAVREGRRAA